MPHLTVDGRHHELPAGSPPPNLLVALRRLGIDVPALCYDERFDAQGACRVCLVETGGRQVAACTTPFADGMTVATSSPALDGVRRTLLGLLADGYPAAALAEDPDQPFHRMLHDFDLAGRCDRSISAAADDAHPLISVDLSRCIDCFRCVRICDEVQGQLVWRIEGRGAGTHVVPDSGTTLAASSCVSCGACVDTCPTGALHDQPRSPAATPTTWTRSTCAYCGVGCELNVGTRDGEVVDVRPAQDAPVNRGHLCVKGRYGHGFAGHRDRLRTPLIRNDQGHLQPASWGEAIEYVVGQLSRIIAERGPDAVGVLGSARATNEDNYVIQKFARAVIGTNNVDCCARVCHAPSATALREMLGTGAATGSYDDIELARTILVAGSNATENHPIVGARIKQAARNGARLIVIDPRRIELAEHADIHLRPRPGTNILVLNALANVIVTEGLVDSVFLHARVDDVDAFTDWVHAYAPEAVAEATGVDPALIRAAARLYALDKPAVSFHGLGLTEHVQGTEAVMCLVNLALLTGNLGRPGAGVNPLRGQNNVQGAAHMGCEPHHLTGFVPVHEGRSRFGPVWGAWPPERPGLDAMEMLDAAAARDLRALWVVGWDLLHTQPDTATTFEALDALDLLVVQDIFLDETARELAHVVLPAASAFEKDGTFMNAERRVQRVRKAIEPPGEARGDWEIFQYAAREMGFGHLLDYRDAGEIWSEVRAVWPPGAGMTYERLDAPGGLQWPCPSVDHPGTIRLHATEFPHLGRTTRLRRIDDLGAASRTDEDHPFLLVTGRGLYQFNAGTMTRRTPIDRLRSTDTLEISESDAQELAVVDGDRVEVRSVTGAAVLPVEVTDRVRPGVVFATFSDPDVGINHVIGPERDTRTHTPEYKVTAVQIGAVGPSSQGRSAAAAGRGEGARWA